MNMLKKYRKERGLTIKQAALLSGMTMSLLSQIEGGHRTIPIEKAQILSKMYKVPIDNIFEPVRFTPRIVEIKE